jgi:hypothetical protein
MVRSLCCPGTRRSKARSSVDHALHFCAGVGRVDPAGEVVLSYFCGCRSPLPPMHTHVLPLCIQLLSLLRTPHASSSAFVGVYT